MELILIKFVIQLEWFMDGWMEEKKEGKKFVFLPNIEENRSKVIVQMRAD